MKARRVAKRKPRPQLIRPPTPAAAFAHGTRGATRTARHVCCCGTIRTHRPSCRLQKATCTRPRPRPRTTTTTRNDLGSSRTSTPKSDRSIGFKGDGDDNETAAAAESGEGGASNSKRGSLADEIVKLKALVDEGVLTQVGFCTYLKSSGVLSKTSHKSISAICWKLEHYHRSMT